MHKSITEPDEYIVLLNLSVPAIVDSTCLAVYLEETVTFFFDNNPV